MSSSVPIARDWRASALAGGVKQSIFGYDVLEFLGEGAGSLIYAVSEPGTNQVYALKHVKVTNEKELRFAEQLMAEYEIGSKVHHPLVRRIFDVKVRRTLLRKITEAVLIMELVDGTPLEAVKGLTVPQIVTIFSQVAQALAGMHANNFVHCDLKPNNILITGQTAVKLIDLGQACPVMTVKARIQGTPDFISPEQVKCEPVTVRTDVFNFGATMYWALAGKSLPTLYNIKRGENSFLLDNTIPSPREVNPAVPENISNFVMECVRSNPAKRPGDMTEVSRRLDVMGIVLARQSIPAQ